jgi:hypothetical protein
MISRRSSAYLLVILALVAGYFTEPSNRIFAADTGCVQVVKSDVCQNGLPIGDYQQLLAVMAANPAPVGHPLAVNPEEVRRYSATSGPAPHIASSFTGMMFDGPLPLTMGWMLRSIRPLTTPDGLPDTSIGRIPRYTPVYVYARVKVNGILWVLIGPGRWVMASVVATVNRASPPAGVDGKWVAVDLAEQTLTVYENDRLLFATLISSGKAPRLTRPGLSTVYLRQETGDMSSLMGGSDPYHIYDVPWIMYFRDGMALHAAPWHDNFGYPMSHGCVNMAITDAHWLFDWTRDTPSFTVLVWRSR